MKGGIRRLFTSCIYLLSLENGVAFVEKNRILHHQGNRLTYANNTNMIKYKVVGFFLGGRQILLVLLSKGLWNRS